MTDREKLIELIQEFADGTYSSNGTIVDGTDVDAVVDHLIANGVTFAKDTNVPSKGHWIIRSSGKGSQTTNWAECSECHVCGSPQWKRCPVCEAKMDLEG